MRIVIDMQGAQSVSRYRGIGRYSLSLALAIARNANHHDIWLVLNAGFPESINSIRYAFKSLLDPQRIRVFQVPTHLAEVDTANVWRTRAAEKIREYFIEQLNPDVLYITSLFEGYTDDSVTSIDKLYKNTFTVVSFYDLIPLLNQSNYLVNEVQRKIYFRKVESLKRADLLLAISDSSKDEAIDALKFPSSQIVNVSAAADEEFKKILLSRKRILELQACYGIQRKIVMYVPGGFDQRKNFEGLISAYSNLSSLLRKKHQLVIVGNIDAERHEYLKKLANKNGLANDELILTGYLDAKELVELYNLATLFVYPSKHEGFGLPLLEAMLCGVPVIGSNVTSIPEVIGLPEALFDPNSPQDISKKIAQVLSDASFRNRLISHGLNQAQKFSWDYSAKLAINAFESHIRVDKPQVNFNHGSEALAVLFGDISRISEAKLPSEQDIISVANCIAFNEGLKIRKQLLLDISVLVHGDSKSGIQRVVRSVLKELITNPPADKDVRPIYFDGGSYKYANKFVAKLEGMVETAKNDWIVDFRQDDIYLALDLNMHLTTALHEFHKRLKFLGIKMYFIVYDILLLEHPEWWQPGTSKLFETWLKSISELATGLVCISESVADELRAWLKQNPPPRIDTATVLSFHLGADIENSSPSKGMPDSANEILAGFKSKLSFLMVGTVEPRKGHAQSLLAFELLWEQGIQANLVIVGKRGWLVEQFVEKLSHHPELNKRLFWLEGVSDEYLEKIYSACACMIASSESEGFGLPLIEAASYQLPIIARDIPVFREVAGKNAYYFSGLKPKDFERALISWMKLYENQQHPKSKDMPYLNWKQSVRDLINLI